MRVAVTVLPFRVPITSTVTPFSTALEDVLPPPL
jgi:hypothetical protein